MRKVKEPIGCLAQLNFALVLKSKSRKFSREILERLNALKGSVFARLDLSKEEQKRDFRLRRELRPQGKGIWKTNLSFEEGK